MEFTQSFNAQDWAQEFVKWASSNPGFATDEGTMIGWFANAIMRGHDTALERRNADPKYGTVEGPS